MLPATVPRRLASLGVARVRLGGPGWALVRLGGPGWALVVKQRGGRRRPVCFGAATPTTELAEGVGFEPTGLLTRRFSRPLHSAALPPFQRHNPSGTVDPTHSISVSA